ncbi:MAG: TetR/AcrR family transcriptional regulator [Streptosporangiaceae bacterium]
MARPRTHDEALRRRLLDSAGQILATGGVPALSLRTLAGAAGTSTSAVYSLFGGKPALLRAIYAEGFARLTRHMAAVEPSDDPAEDLVQLGLAYRTSALQNPRLYPVMFGHPPAGMEPGEAERGAGRQAFALLAAAVGRGVQAGTFPAGSERRLTLAAWALAHGLVSLELHGLLPAGAQADYERILRDTVEGWRN